MSTSLVTGGAGFIGSHVARHLIEAGHKVVILDDLSGGFIDNVPRGASFVEGSVLDHRLIDRLFRRHQFDYVYHLAAYAAEGLSHFIKRFNYNNNLVGSVNLINASVNHGVKCFVFTSSIAVYGAGRSPMTEDMHPEPEDPYGVAKLAVELELGVTRSMFGMDHVIFRPHNVYGEGQNIGDRYRNVVGIFMNQLLRGEPMTIFGDGEQQRAMTYIDDVAPVIAGCVEYPAARNQVFNLGADEPVTVNHLARVIADAMGFPRNVKHLDQRNEVKVAFSDHGKASRIFGHRATTPLAQGISATAEWVKVHGSRESSIFSGIEIERNLPASWKAAAVEAKTGAKAGVASKNGASNGKAMRGDKKKNPARHGRMVVSASSSGAAPSTRSTIRRSSTARRRT